MSWITRLSLKNIGLILISIVLILTGGIWAASSMKLEQYPNVDIPYLSFTVVYPGATPAQVQDDLAKPLEDVLANMDDLENLYVTSASNVAWVMLQFGLSTDMEKAESAVNQALAKAKLPETAKPSSVNREGPSAQSVYLFAVKAKDDYQKVQEYVLHEVEPRLRTVNGVAEVEVHRTSDQQIQVKVDPRKLDEKGVTLDQVRQAILASNASIPTGEVTFSDKTMTIQVGAKLASLDEIKNVPIFVVKQSTSGLTNAFTDIGEGMKDLGGAIGDLGKVVGGTVEQQEYIKAEIQLTNAASQLQMKLASDQAMLEQLKKVPDNPTTQADITKLVESMQSTKAQLDSVKTKLAEVQAKTKQISERNQAELKALGGAKSTTSPSNAGESAEPAVTIQSLKLADVADIKYGYTEQSSFTRLNGEQAVVVGIKPSIGENTVEIVENTEQIIHSLDLPKGYELVTLRDQSIDIKKSVSSMLREAVFGAILAAVVTLIFLRNFRTTLVAILSIPLSIFITFVVMLQMGYTLNMMTLAGIAVAVGRVVDDSIVVMENLYRRIQLSKGEERGNSLILKATAEVAQAITSSTITTIAVFIPLAFVKGLVGRFFEPFAWSVVLSIAFSWLISITVIPVLSKLFLMNMKPVEHKETALQRVYEKVLGWSLHHKRMVMLLSVLLIAGSFALVPRVPVNFFPTEEAQFYRISVDLPVGTSLKKTNRVAQEIEDWLKATKATEFYQTTVQPAGISIQVSVKEDANPRRFENVIRTRAKTLEKGVDLALQASSISPGGGGLFLIVNGPSHETIKKAAIMMEETIEGIKGVADVSSNVSELKPQISIDVDEEKAASVGFYPAMIASTLRDYISGNTVTTVNLEGQATDVLLSLASDEWTTIEAIKNQKLTNPLGDEYLLKEVAEVKETTGPTSVQRLNQQEYISIQGKFTTDNSRDIQLKIQENIKKLDLPEGVTYKFEGEAKQINEGFQNMFVAIGISILLVYLVMMVTFGEMTAPFAILFSLPFIFVGVILGIILMNESLGMPALVGILMLIGIVVTNAIVLIDRVKQNELAGDDVEAALIEAGKTRIRPILMTAFATIGALIPLALSTEGGLISRSLAIVVISGLTTSTLLTLVIVPVAYLILSNIKSKILKNVE